MVCSGPQWSPGAVAALQAAVERLGKAHDFRELAAGRQETMEPFRMSHGTTEMAGIGSLSDFSDGKTQQEFEEMLYEMHCKALWKLDF